MPRKSKPRDLNRLAAKIVSEATDERTEEERIRAQGKHPDAVALGRLGGEKGGKSRAASLTPEQRREIAKKAAAARWRKSEYRIRR